MKLVFEGTREEMIQVIEKVQQNIMNMTMDDGIAFLTITELFEGTGMIFPKEIENDKFLIFRI